MRILKIEDNKGLFLGKDNQYITIDDIDKNALLNLVNRVLGNEDVEIDEFDEANLANQAHQVIYKSLSNKLLNLKSRKNEFIDESQRLFLEDYQRYTSDLQDA